MANRSIPVGFQDYYQKANLEEVLKRLDKTNVVILAGVSGSGKTELARQVLKKLNRVDEEVVEWRFRCDSIPILLSELRNYLHLKGFEIDGLNTTDIGEVFEEFYTCINDKFPEKLKYFLFDDAETATKLVYHIDSKIFGPLLSMPYDSPLRKSWKIVVTTQISSNDWLHGCDHITSEHFLKINGFSDDEMIEFLHRVERARSLTDDDIDLIKEKFGHLPLMLKALRKEIESDLSVSASEILRSLVRRIDQIDPEDRMHAALLVSLNRLVSQSIQSDHYKQLLMMLTMFSECNLTTELLISCAEVILAGDNLVQELPNAAYKLQKCFVADLVQQTLCDRPVEFSGTSLISLHKLVQQSMNMLRRPTDPQRDAAMARKALIALTRVMPRDGRSHQSHVIYDYMYNHALCLAKEVKRLHDWGAVDRVRTPTIFLLVSSMQASMSYCQFVLKTPTASAAAHIKEALNSYSQLFADRDYDELGAWLPDRPVDVQRSDTLYEESIGVQSVLYNNVDYGRLVNDAPLFQRLTNNDVTLLTGYGMDSPESRLVNSHLTYSHMRDLQMLRKILEPVKLKELYAAEVLANIFSMAARTTEHYREAAIQHSQSYGEAALNIYRKIKNEFAVTLFGEIITERKMLNIRLAAPTVTHEELEEIDKQWQVLSTVDGKAYEYGILRVDFQQDDYHKFLCEEGHIRTLGRKCAISYSDTQFEDINHQFLVLIEKTSSEDPKLHANYMMTCKAYQNYAEFLWQCNKLRDAVRALIDSFFFLNLYLRTKNHKSKFPEQEGTCARTKPLLQLLCSYYEAYDKTHSEGGLLQHDGTDQQRIYYVTEFVKFWVKNDRAGSDRLRIMEQVLLASDIDIEDPYVHQAVPVQASGL